MTRDKILVVGGYGQVGRYVTLELMVSFPKKIIIAGRSLEKASSFAKEYNNSFETIKLDIYNIEEISIATKDVKVAVMCLSPKTNDFVSYCAKNGIHYIDISPSYDVAKNIERFREEAEAKQSTCILGVGLAPGLSNLLVKELNKKVGILQKVSIHLLLGLGESHGKDGVNWLLENIQYDFIANGKKVSPFVNGKKAIFIDPLGKRKVYHFNLADQFIIPKTLHIGNVSSYFCYDSRIITFYVSILKRIGIFSLLKYTIPFAIISAVFNTTLRIIHKLKLFTDIYSIKIDAIGIKDDKEYLLHAGIKGNDNSLLTGKITAFVAEQLYTKNIPFGVFYLEELFSLADLNSHGILPKTEINIE